MSESDFWGNHITRKEKLTCHHQLNKCVADPFVQYVDKLPGDSCLNNYECISNQCVFFDGIKQCGGYGEDTECSHDN